METQEIWKEIEGYDGYYFISNLGRVKVRQKEYFYPSGKLRKIVPEKILHQNKHRGGYLTVMLKGKRFYIHRLVAFAFLDKGASKTEVNHIDGNKANNTLCNLEWVTSKENKHHAIEKGLTNNRGENNTSSVLTNEDAIKIVNDNRKQKDIAADYGVCFQKISDIKKGRLYSIATGIKYNPKKKTNLKQEYFQGK
jgi:hypothetical protein